MENATTFRLKRFLLSLSLALLAGVIYSSYEIPRVLGDENYLHFHLWPLALGLVQKIVTASLLTSILLGAFLGLISLFLPKSLNDAWNLYFQGILILLLLAIFYLVKHYSWEFLPGNLIYFIFDVNRWVKEHLAFFIILATAFFILVPVLIPNGAFLKFLTRFAIPFWLLIILAVNISHFSWKLYSQQKLIETDAPNIILLTIDTLRSDHMGLYGYPRNTSPNLDQFGKENVVFTNAVCQWPKTSQSFASMLTGTYFYATGLPINVATRLSKRNLLLAEIFLAAGYKTAAFTSNANLAKYFDFADGFESYVELWHKQSGPARELAWHRSDRVIDQTIEWLKKNKHRKFFLWSHSVDPHTPYSPPPPYDKIFLNDAWSNQYDPVPFEKISEYTWLGKQNDPDFFVSQYDGEILFNDTQVARLLEALDELKLKDNTILLFTSDHGESFVEHDLYLDHGKYPFEDCARVPLILSAPGKSRLPAARVEAPVSLIDIAPTLLSLANIEVANISLQGKNLLDLIRDPQKQAENFRYQFIESGDSKNYMRAVRDTDWKLVYIPEEKEQKELGVGPFSLYRYKTDPGEAHDVLEKFPNEAARLKEKLLVWMDEGLKRTRTSDRGGPRQNEPELDKASLEQLKSFGYL